LPGHGAPASSGSVSPELVGSPPEVVA
jgi:hypothetical protein